LLPGFVDGQGHCLQTGLQAASANLLPPPDHKVRDIPSLQNELREWSTTEKSNKYGLVFGFGYDDAQWVEQRHPNRHDLDEVSRDLPLVIIHQSGHLSSMNSKALEIAGITAQSKAPLGSVIRREDMSDTANGFRIGGVKFSFNGSPQGKTAYLSQPDLIPPHGQSSSYRGDWHRDSVLGPQRAERISPARSALRRGMNFSQYHDAPVALPSAIRILSSVVTRRTRSGDILGAEQCIPLEAGLKYLTIWPAYHHYEEKHRGSIEVGKLADFVILDRNPLKIDTQDLAMLKVQETIKEGKTIYRSEDASILEWESSQVVYLSIWHDRGCQFNPLVLFVLSETVLVLEGNYRDFVNKRAKYWGF
jgi:predicted amidohydrolase YtcJ